MGVGNTFTNERRCNVDRRNSDNKAEVVYERRAPHNDNYNDLYCKLNNNNRELSEIHNQLNILTKELNHVCGEAEKLNRNSTDG
jgi:hypothetical protein